MNVELLDKGKGKCYHFCMARPYRIHGEGLMYHVMSRGDDRKRIFLSETDYNKFFEYLTLAKAKYKFYLFAYCLMTNHYHLLLETTQANISKIMQYINTSYTTYYNIKRNKCGHLFQGRYKSILVDKDGYFLELTRYIHLNPVKAKIVDLPEEYKRSSYNSYLNKKEDAYIDKAEIFRIVDIRPNQYKRFVLDGINKADTLFSKIYAGSILGTEEFIKERMKILKDEIETKQFSYKKELVETIAPRDIVAAVAKRYKKDVTSVCQSKTRRAIEKKIAIYLIKRYTNLTNNQIGKIFSITYSAVSKVAKDIKNVLDRDKRIKNEVEGIISSFKA